MALPMRYGRFYWSAPESQGEFYPDGPLLYVGDDSLRENPVLWEDEGPTLAARILLGLNARGKRRRSQPTIDDVVGAAHELLLPLTGEPRDYYGTARPGASFAAQKGLYRYRRKGMFEDVEEDGVQVLLVNLWGVPLAQWKRDVVWLAEELAARFNQEQVIAEVQRNGITLATWGVGPP